jgi:hypothetical protein
MRTGSAPKAPGIRSHLAPKSLKPLGLEAVHPDGFLLDQLDLSPPTLLQVIREQAAHTRRPPLAPRDLATLLSRAGFRTSPTRSSASWPPLSTAPDTGMGAAASEDYESCSSFWIGIWASGTRPGPEPMDHASVSAPPAEIAYSALV